MIYNLHRDPPRLRLVERPGGIAVERGPGFRVDLCLEARLERIIGIVRAEKVCVSDEEALFVVVGVDEPAGDPLGTV